MTIKDIQELCNAYKNDAFVREQIKELDDKEQVSMIMCNDDSSFSILTDKSLRLINTAKRQIKINNELLKKRSMSYGI